VGQTITTTTDFTMADVIEKSIPSPEANSSDVEDEKVYLGKDELLLAKLGYKQEFHRKLGFFGANLKDTFATLELCC
jgi:hypothetical protein